MGPLLRAAKLRVERSSLSLSSLFTNVRAGWTKKMRTVQVILMNSAVPRSFSLSASPAILQPSILHLRHGHFDAFRIRVSNVNSSIVGIIEGRDRFAHYHY